MSLKDNPWYDRILNVNDSTFESLALDVFFHQCKNNPAYRQYCTLLDCNPDKVQTIDQIPFLPISHFKERVIKTNDWEPEMLFQSSGTTGQLRSKHAVRNLNFYHHICMNSFKSIYKKEVNEFCWFGLLPGYLERKDASLVSMVDHFIKKSKCSQSGFYLDEHYQLFSTLVDNENADIQSVLIGVSFALLDFADFHNLDHVENLIVIETGGMKGRREELTRNELHTILSLKLGIRTIHSEYGMTELFSQAYAPSNGRFISAPTMRVKIADLTDPLSFIPNGKRGAIQVIDLANVDTCSFIATEDVGICHDDGTFEVLGRMDGSEWRGCNLMVL